MESVFVYEDDHDDLFSRNLLSPLHQPLPVIPSPRWPPPELSRHRQCQSVRRRHEELPPAAGAAVRGRGPRAPGARLQRRLRPQQPARPQRLPEVCPRHRTLHQGGS